MKSVEGFVLKAGDYIADDFIEFHRTAAEAESRRVELKKEHPDTEYLIFYATLNVSEDEL